MSEITRVALPPVGQGALSRLWLGVGLAVLAGVTVAWAARPVHYSELHVITEKAGTGKTPTAGDVVLINYVGRLATTGKVFDKGNRVPLPAQGSIPGFEQALLQTKVGGKYRFEIPAALAYGDHAMPNNAGEIVIPANSDLTFEIELLDVRNRAEVEKEQAAMQAMQAAIQSQQAQGAQSAPPPPGN